MALFDLRCNNCQKEFTTFVSFAKLAEAKCPKCKSQDHERVYKAHVKGPVRSQSSSRSAIPTSGFT
ncbi:MAG TPA: FmdB family zinc ribbon protein [Bacillota bacterium]|nr:FmdB family zinc ribbon protein [Bacillota bacterium]